MNERMTAQSQSRRTDSPVPFPWLTVEIGLWGLLLLISLGLRLLRLGVVPLNSPEAQDALIAWRFSNGQGVPTAAGYSPIMFSAQSLLFLLFTADEVTARLLPALAGTALALSPALLRAHIGRVGALTAGILLSISPTALALSRTASGDVLVTLGALLFASGLWNILTHARDEDPPDTQIASRIPLPAYLIPLGLALVFVSSPLAYSALLTLGLALLTTALVDLESRDQLQKGWMILRTLPNSLSYLMGTWVTASVLLSTAFAWNLGGIAAATDLFPQWLDGFVRWSDSLSLAYPGFILVVYEPLILLTGGVGATLAAIRGNSTTLFMTLWSVLALLLALIRPGHGPGDVLLILVPLACLSGSALDILYKDLRRWGHWLNEGLFLAISTPLWAYLVINLATYSSQPHQYTQINLLFINVSLPTYLSLSVVAAVTLLIVAIFMSAIQGTDPTLRGLGLSTTLALLLFTIATTWGVNQNRPADPREPLILEPTATEVRLLRDSLVRFSLERQGDAHSIDVALLTDDSALAWALREFHQARVIEVTSTPSFASIVIAPQALGKPPLGGDYIGQSFSLRRSWSTDGLACRWNQVPIGRDTASQLDCSTLVNWFMFRRSPTPPLDERVVLWARQDLVTNR